MTIETSFLQQTTELKEKIDKLQDDCDKKVIEQTASRLEGLNYAPPVITPISVFLRMNKHALLDEVDRILALPDQEACALAPDDTRKCEDLRLEYIRVATFYYEKLILLRQGNAEEWDEVDELYVHD